MKGSKRRKTVEQKLRRLRKTLRNIVAYPPEVESRRTDDGYPSEFTYDEFAYKRMVDSYRKAIQKAIDKSLTKRR